MTSPSTPMISKGVYAIEISFGGVGIHLSREAHAKLVEAVDFICTEHEIANPDRTMWAGT